MPSFEEVAPESDDSIWPISGKAFRELGTIRRLLNEGLPAFEWLNRCGVYAIVLPEGYEVGFLDAEDVRGAGNVISPWPIGRLRDKWVEGTRIVYIGLAGSSSYRPLRNRLRSLLRHASGKTSDRGPHKGGEIIWQLAEFGTFSVWAMATEGPPMPRTLEQELLMAFHERHGALPFANRQF